MARKATPKKKAAAKAAPSDSRVIKTQKLTWIKLEKKK